jgi:hypothetical protein
MSSTKKNGRMVSLKNRWEKTHESQDLRARLYENGECNANKVDSGGRRCFGCKKVVSKWKFTKKQYSGEFCKVRYCINCQKAK